VSVALNPALLPPGGIPGDNAPGTSRPAPAAAPTGPSFADVLQRAAKTSGAQPLHFSKHALQRVERRGIPLDPSTLSRLEDGVGRAAGKGSRDSVVLVDGTAFVVSVANRTVLTAVSPEHMREHVFTNIDSAVLA
jgi:flagellar operon protein